MTNDQEHDPISPSWRPRFGIGGLLLVTFVFSVMGSAGYYFVQAIRGGRSAQFGFILFTLASPLLLVVLVSLLKTAFDAIQRK